MTAATGAYALVVSRLASVHAQWRAAAAAGAGGGDAVAARCDALACVFGVCTANTLENQRGQAMAQYLLDAPVPVANVAVVLTRDAVLLTHDGGRIDARTVPATLPRDDNDTAAVTVTCVDDAAHFDAALARLLHTTRRRHGSSSGSADGDTAAPPVVVGAPLRELDLQEGAFAQHVIAALRRGGDSDNDDARSATAEEQQGQPPPRKATGGACQLVEAAPLLGSLLFVKDAAALASVEKAAGLCTAVFRRHVRALLEEQLLQSKPQTLHELREQLCAALASPTTIHGLETLDAGAFAVAAGLTPCIFHKGAYTYAIQLSPQQLQQAPQLQQPLARDVLVVRYGVKHRGYTAFLARTLLVQSGAPASAQAAYQFVYDVSEHVQSLLTPGSRLCDVYAAAHAAAVARNASLAALLPKSLGFVTGLLVLESRGTISDKGTAVVMPGMCLVVRIALERVPAGNDNNNGNDNDSHGDDVYGIELADTVVVRDAAVELKTKAARRLADVLYEDTANADDAEKENDDDDKEDKTAAFAPRDLSKITRQGHADTIIVSREAQREAALRTLLHELHSEFLASGGKRDAAAAAAAREEHRQQELGLLACGELKTLTLSDTPPPPPPVSTSSSRRGGSGGICVQADKRVVWLPIFGHATPFHVATISKVEVRREGSERHVMTVTFHSLQEANVAYRLHRTCVFVKELTYTAPRDVFSDVQAAVQAVQQRIKSDDAERKRRATTAAAGGQLTLAADALRLPQVKMRPPIIVGRQNKNCVGNLELHQNGLRFSFLGGAPVQLPFSNIKHIIFQPAVNAIAVIYHITLKQSIELGRKATSEVQFVAEVMESSEAATGARRSYEEEVAAEERDEARVRETNKQFMYFARAVEQRGGMRTQLPINQFAFDGVHARAMTTFKGSKEVLWAVSDWPAFTQRVDEIEVVSFERIVPGGSTFDVTFILKDYHKPVVTIHSIAKSSLETLKDWCLAARLYYMQTTVNPNWKATMKDIRDDPDWSPWLPGAGWSLLNNETNDEEDDDDDDDDESDSTYYEEEDEEDDSDSDDDSSWLEDEESDVASSKDSGNSDDDASDDDSDVSWDALERKAREQDRRQNYSDVDDDDDDGVARHSRKRARAQGNGNGQRATPAAATAARRANAPVAAAPRKTPMTAMRNTVPPPPARRY